MDASVPDHWPASESNPAPEPVPPNGPDAELAALRAALDQLDNQLHDTLMQRAAIVARIGASRAKGGVKLRPGREAAILRRLLDRHQGPLPAHTVVRVWREIFAGSTAMQAPFTVAAVMGLDTVARDHFGALTPLQLCPTPDQALDCVRTGQVSAAVLPWPAGDEPWLDQLARPEPPLHLVGRLPFWADRPDNAPRPQAAVVSLTPPDPSGCDCTVSRTPDGKALIVQDGLDVPHSGAVIGLYARPILSSHQHREG